MNWFLSNRLQALAVAAVIASIGPSVRAEETMTIQGQLTPVEFTTPKASVSSKKEELPDGRVGIVTTVEFEAGSELKIMLFGESIVSAAELKTRSMKEVVIDRIKTINSGSSGKTAKVGGLEFRHFHERFEKLGSDLHYYYYAHNNILGTVMIAVQLGSKSYEKVVASFKLK